MKRETWPVVQINWKNERGAAPFPMSRGSSTINGNVAYFSGYDSCTIHSYHTQDKVWVSLPPCPVKNFGLEVINGLVTTIGGCNAGFIGSESCSLYTLTDQKWEKQLPPMPTRHESPATAQCGKFLSVVGGRNTTSVDILDTNTKEWSAAAVLPQNVYLMSAALCNDKLYLLGGYKVFSDAATRKVFTCTVSDLLGSCSQPHTAASVWQQIADAPLLASTCVAVNGEILAIGGRHSWEWTPKSDIYRYDPASKSWNKLGDLPSPRYSSLAVVLPGKKLMVVGGYVGYISQCNISEFGLIS